MNQPDSSRLTTHSPPGLMFHVKHLIQCDVASDSVVSASPESRSPKRGAWNGSSPGPASLERRLHRLDRTARSTAALPAAGVACTRRRGLGCVPRACVPDCVCCRRKESDHCIRGCTCMASRHNLSRWRVRCRANQWTVQCATDVGHVEERIHVGRWARRCSLSMFHVKHAGAGGWTVSRETSRSFSRFVGWAWFHVKHRFLVGSLDRRSGPGFDTALARLLNHRVGRGWLRVEPRTTSKPA